VRGLVWCERFWPFIGGVELLVADLLVALGRRGYEFTIVTQDELNELPRRACYAGIPILRLPLRRALADDRHLLPEIAGELVQLKRRFQPDLIHLNSLGASALFHLATARTHPAPLLVTLHGALPSNDLGSPTLIGRLLRSADWFSSVSAIHLEEVRRLLPELRPRSSVIYSGVQSPTEPPAPLPIQDPRLLCLGRLSASKGFELALDAFAKVRGRFPHLRLTVAGDGYLRPDLERLAQDLEVRGSVDFLGWVAPEHVAAVIDTATMVVMPSRTEGIPLVAIQAALMARPVVATRVGGNPEIVRHRETGLLVEPEDSKALGEAIAWLLGNPHAAAEYGREARRQALEKFSFDRCADQYDALYRRLMWEGRRC
jgi:glycogen(starch) synthase